MFDGFVSTIGNDEYVLNNTFLIFVDVKCVAGEYVDNAHAFIIDKYIVDEVLCDCKLLM